MAGRSHFSTVGNVCSSWIRASRRPSRRVSRATWATRWGFPAYGSKVIAIGSILIIAAVNIAGLRLGSGLMQGLTALKLGALALIAVLAFALHAGSWSNLVPFVAQRAGSDPLPVALAAGLVAPSLRSAAGGKSPNWR